MGASKLTLAPSSPAQRVMAVFTPEKEALKYAEKSIGDRATDLLLLTSGELNTNRCKSKMVGASCILIAAPGCWAWYTLPAQVWWGLGGVMVGVCATVSDYLLVDAPDVQTRRQAFALDLAMIYLYVAGSLLFGVWQLRVGLTAVLFASLIAGKLLVLEYSAQAATPSEWCWRHSIWHVYVFNLAFLSHISLASSKCEWLWSDPRKWQGPDVAAAAIAASMVLQLLGTGKQLLAPQKLLPPPDTVDTLTAPSADHEAQHLHPVHDPLPSTPVQWLSGSYRASLVVLMLAMLAWSWVCANPPFENLSREDVVSMVDAWRAKLQSYFVAPTYN